MYSATELVNKGYRRISNKYRTVSRIDREDWLDAVYRHRFGKEQIAIKEALKLFYKNVSINDFI